MSDTSNNGSPRGNLNDSDRFTSGFVQKNSRTRSNIQPNRWRHRATPARVSNALNYDNFEFLFLC